MNNREKKARVWCPGGDGEIIGCHSTDKKYKGDRPKLFRRCPVCDQRFELVNSDCCCPNDYHPRMPRHKALLKPSSLVKIEEERKKREEEYKKLTLLHQAKKGKLTVLPRPERILCSICKVVPRRPNKPFCNTPECTRLGTRQERQNRKRSSELLARPAKIESE